MTLKIYANVWQKRIQRNLRTACVRFHQEVLCVFLCVDKLHSANSCLSSVRDSLQWLIIFQDSERFFLNNMRPWQLTYNLRVLTVALKNFDFLSNVSR